MVLRTDPEPEPEVMSFNYYSEIFVKFKELIEKCIVSESDRVRLLQQVEKLDDDIQRRIKDTLGELGDIRRY